jgi:hypothetical protein
VFYREHRWLFRPSTELGQWLRAWEPYLKVGL